MNHQHTLNLITEIIHKLEEIKEIDTITSLAKDQINADLFRISSLSKSLHADFRLQNKDINWDMFDRLAFANIGSGFSETDLENLLIKNNFGLINEFEKLKMLLDNEKMEDR